MNIIREGDKGRTDPIYRFHCWGCDCIWECHQSECQKKENTTIEDYLLYGGAFVDELCEYKCPCCESVTTGENVHNIELRTRYRSY